MFVVFEKEDEIEKTAEELVRLWEIELEEKLSKQSGNNHCR